MRHTIGMALLVVGAAVSLICVAYSAIKDHNWWPAFGMGVFMYAAALAWAFT
ncbi:MAG: hypothetical protein WC935_00115 [Thermoleophilia bacterium]